MNKEFFDPNLKYSDQKVDLAKMPGMLQTISQSLGEMGESVREIPVLQKQVSDLSSTVDDIDDNVGDIQDTLSTTGATAGKVLKVETPGEAPVWGEAGGGIGPVALVQFAYGDDGLESSMTYDEIIGAVIEGKTPLGVCSGWSSAALGILVPGEPLKFSFIGVVAGTGTSHVLREFLVSLNNSNVITTTTTDYSLTEVIT